MDNSGADRNLLFGLLALQNGLIDQFQLVAGFQSWTLEKERPLGDHLVSRGALDAFQFEVVEAMVGLHLQKHGDSPATSLAALPATSFTTQSRLAGLGDPELTVSLAGLPRMGTRPDSGFEETLDIGLGSAGGSSGLAGLDAGMKTFIRHVTLHDTEPGDCPPSANGGNGELKTHGQAGRYQLMGEIARGGMGSVLKGP